MTRLLILAAALVALPAAVCVCLRRGYAVEVFAL
jgi:hypothetical protein